MRPNHGHFHCFGCGEGGDVYAFVQKIEHVTFVEAVELLADRVGYTVTYTGAATSVQRDRGSRSRLLAANAAAQEFYAEALKSDEAAPARQYLLDRNFDAETAAQFGCGFAPSGWDTLTKHLLRKGFEFKELEAAGLSPGRAARPDGPLPPSAAVADPGVQRRGHRVRRPPALRRRPERSEVRQHPRDRAVQEVVGAVRPRPRQARYRQGPPGGRRRGLHRRDGDASGRGDDRGGVVRYRVRRRAPGDAAATHDGRQLLSRRTDLRVRRRRGRPGGGGQGVRRRTEPGRAVVRRGGRRRHGPVRPATEIR